MIHILDWRFLLPGGTSLKSMDGSGNFKSLYGWGKDIMKFLAAMTSQVAIGTSGFAFPRMQIGIVGAHGAHP